MALPRITWKDAQHAPEDGQRYEAIGGRLYVTAAPSNRHQRISLKLAVALHRILEAPGHGLVFAAPSGVEFPETGEGVQPDLFFVARDRREIVGEDWTRGAPDLVVEIVSPSTADRDRTLKRDLYRSRGVSTYWIVDPDAGAVEVWRFTDPDPTRTVHDRRLPVRPGEEEEVAGEIDLEALFEREF